MRRKTLFTGILLGISFALFAQNPGYLGKHFILQVQGAAAPVIYGPTAKGIGIVDNYDENSGWFAIHDRIGAKLSYALSRKNAVSFAVEQFQTGMIMTAFSPSKLQFIGQPWVYDAHDLLYELTGTSYQLHWSTFNPIKGSLAPYGAYASLVLEADFLDGKVAEDQITYYFSEYQGGYTSTRIEPHVTYWSAGGEFGINHIFFDRLVLNIAARFSIPLQLNRFNPGYELQAPSYNEDFEDYNQFFFEQKSIRKMARYNLVWVSLGAGYLIF